jgi:hypothetical protein
MRAIEVTIQNLIGSGMDPKTENNPYLGFIYTSFQERATKVRLLLLYWQQDCETAVSYVAPTGCVAGVAVGSAIAWSNAKLWWLCEQSTCA